MINIRRLDFCEYDKLPSFIRESESPVILSCLQGQAGHVFVDNSNSPKSIMLVALDISFFFGKPNREFAENLPADVRNPGFYIFNPSSDWVSMLREVHGNSLKKITRYAFFHDTSGLDETVLNTFISRISKNFCIAPIDEALYNKAMSEAWSKDLCQGFYSFSDYQERGRGFAAFVKKTGELACGASSYLVYNKGIEIEIDTKKEYRQKGLATACASALILSCLKDNIYPSWDAANLKSVGLAQKLGYKLSHEYDTYYIEKD